MADRITNRTGALLTIGLNTGDSLHLAPGETSGDVPEYETQGNPWLEKLVDRGQAAVERAPAAARRRTARRRAGKKK
jgi:hypothetical protein